MKIQFFTFEADFVESLRCIPMIVRFRLDQCCIKLSLRAWSRFDFVTRANLTQWPTSTAEEIDRYRDYLSTAIENVGESVVMVSVNAQPPWQDTSRIPDAIVEKAGALGIALNGPKPWRYLTDLERFALVKLTRHGHENANFPPALKELGLTI